MFVSTPKNIQVVFRAGATKLDNKDMAYVNKINQEKSKKSFFDRVLDEFAKMERDLGLAQQATMLLGMARVHHRNTEDLAKDSNAALRRALIGDQNKRKQKKKAAVLIEKAADELFELMDDGIDDLSAFANAGDEVYHGFAATMLSSNYNDKTQNTSSFSATDQNPGAVHQRLYEDSINRPNFDLHGAEREFEEEAARSTVGDDEYVNDFLNDQIDGMDDLDMVGGMADLGDFGDANPLSGGFEDPDADDGTQPLPAELQSDGEAGDGEAPAAKPAQKKKKPAKKKGKVTKDKAISLTDAEFRYQLAHSHLTTVRRPTILDYDPFIEDSGDLVPLEYDDWLHNKLVARMIALHDQQAEPKIKSTKKKTQKDNGEVAAGELSEDAALDEIFGAAAVDGPDAVQDFDLPEDDFGGFAPAMDEPDFEDNGLQPLPRTERPAPGMFTDDDLKAMPLPVATTVLSDKAFLRYANVVETEDKAMAAEIQERVMENEGKNKRHEDDRAGMYIAAVVNSLKDGEAVEIEKIIRRDEMKVTSKEQAQDKRHATAVLFMQSLHLIRDGTVGYEQGKGLSMKLKRKAANM
ncbi:hypothetical protein J8273_2889 [Carpediemonas membranifera]|uniref:Uncharacterized protein n=1 Tax=Carpediemonas membranifera TaxID=201153 RepID=A0A8J6B0B5_9EUKA|nr:hypothetical protein J8273_2889 [Carpediemonas membranifera]|eukprot:KAG9395685.1 hypothetical protein J8273_2889 [Carpediemonas membranifera]